MLKIWRSPNRRFLSYPPGHYYSPLPDYGETDGSNGQLPFKGAVDLRTEQQLALIEALRPYLNNSQFLRQRSAGRRYYFDNIYFTGLDALALYAMLRHSKPARVVEVGSGYSSALMLDTSDEFLNSQVMFTFIDPEPERIRSLLRGDDEGNVTILPRRIQDVDLSVFEGLEEKDILFIDSSHVSKYGSDVNRLFFEILPALRNGVYVHIHDVFWPFEYPHQWYLEGRAWNELYLLRAFLQYNDAFRIELFLSYLNSLHGENLAGLLNDVKEDEALLGASSLWLYKQSRSGESRAVTRD
jgi:predicted O-methyltransferase YrrM